MEFPSEHVQAYCNLWTFYFDLWLSNLAFALNNAILYQRTHSHCFWFRKIFLGHWKVIGEALSWNLFCVCRDTYTTVGSTNSFPAFCFALPFHQQWVLLIVLHKFLVLSIFECKILSFHICLFVKTNIVLPIKF